MNRLRFAWLVSMVAMFGSLYFSEVRGFVPCELCWYQRILMYPLTMLMGIAVFKNNKGIFTYVLPFSVIGMFVSTYHYLVQKTDWFETIQTCTQGVPCSGMYINYFGFITIPFLALIAFTLITGTILYDKYKTKKGE